VVKIVRDHAKSDPTLHTSIASANASSKTVSPLQDADAALASGQPFVALLEPALLLLALPLGAFGGTIRNAHPLHTPVVRCGFIPG